MAINLNKIYNSIKCSHCNSDPHVWDNSLYDKKTWNHNIYDWDHTNHKNPHNPYVMSPILKHRNEDRIKQILDAAKMIKMANARRGLLINPVQKIPEY